MGNPGPTSIPARLELLDARLDTVVDRLDELAEMVNALLEAVFGTEEVWRETITVPGPDTYPLPTDA